MALTISSEACPLVPPTRLASTVQGSGSPPTLRRITPLSTNGTTLWSRSPCMNGQTFGSCETWKSLVPLLELRVSSQPRRSGPLLTSHLLSTLDLCSVETLPMATVTVATAHQYRSWWSVLPSAKCKHHLTPTSPYQPSSSISSRFTRTAGTQFQSLVSRCATLRSPRASSSV
jgi:hypothetical protein